MTFLEQLLTVWRALWANKLRSFLTLLGVIMGVGTIVLLSSLVGGGLAAIGRTVQSASGEDVITVSVDRWNVKGIVPPQLSDLDLRALVRAPSLADAHVTPQLEARLDAEAGNKKERVWLVGSREDAPSFYQLELAEGRFLSAADGRDQRRVAVVGHKVASALYSGSALGQDVRLGGERFRIVGVLSDKPSLNVGNLTWNNAVAIPDASFIAWRGKSEYRGILVRAPQAEGAAAASMTRTVRAVLEGRHHPSETLRVEGAGSKKGDSSEQAFLQALQILLVAVAAICLLVGGINIMNIMLVTVTERTREIGLRLAIGARQRDIRNQFLFEAAAIAGFGGVVGVVGGLALAWGICTGLSLAFGYWPFVVDGAAIAVAFASALVVGVVFGWFPARKAARLSPIDCLRYE